MGLQDGNLDVLRRSGAGAGAGVWRPTLASRAEPTSGPPPSACPSAVSGTHSACCVCTAALEPQATFHAIAPQQRRAWRLLLTADTAKRLSKLHFRGFGVAVRRSRQSLSALWRNLALAQPAQPWDSSRIALHAGGLCQGLQPLFEIAQPTRQPTAPTRFDARTLGLVKRCSPVLPLCFTRNVAYQRALESYHATSHATLGSAAASAALQL